MATSSLFHRQKIIYLKYTHQGKHILMSTGVKAESNELNHVTRRGKKQIDKAAPFNKKKPGFSSLNKRIHNKLADLERTILKAEELDDLSTRNIKMLFSGEVESYSLVDALKFAASSLTNYRSIQAYNTLINHLEGWGDPLLTQMDHNFYYKVVSHFRSAGAKDSTIDKQIKTIKAACRKMEKRGIEVHSDVRRYDRLRIHYDKFYLHEGEVTTLFKTKVKPELVKYRDMFVLHCYLGLRVSDFKRISKDWINGNVMTVAFQQKTKAPITIPLNQTAIKILKKYDYKLPQRADQVYNRQIKKVCEAAKLNRLVTVDHKEVPLHTVASSKTAKKTFATHAISLGLTPDEIEVITGTSAAVIRKNYAGELGIKGIAEKMGVNLR